jgi:cytidylate kinase
VSTVIAIDGPAGSGKSTLARALAERLGYDVLDTGAMYRALTVECLRRGVDVSSNEDVSRLARSIVVTTLPEVSVDGHCVGHLLRTPEVNVAVSSVAALPGAREAMVAAQRAQAATSARGLVAEGRDLTTVVFPDATLKIFLTASLDERARRRGDESRDSVARRDHLDSTRAASPLAQAPDARVLDTTGRSVADLVEEVVQWLANTTSH